MSTEFPNQADELANRPPATELPPLLLQQAEAVDWAPPPCQPADSAMRR
jgi:hypothetical protein